MSETTRIGEGPQWELPLDVEPPPAPEPKPKPRKPAPPGPPRAVPVARRAVNAPVVRTGPAVEEDPNPLSPRSVRSWAGSLALHLLLLLIMALWIVHANTNPAAVIETTLAGSPLGSDLSDQLTGGLGMDEPLAMPEAPGSALEHTTLTVLPPIGEVALDAEAARSVAAAAAGASSGGGVNLTNPGQAGSGDGFGVARFGTGTERVKGTEVKVGDPQFTLIWEGLGDLDLHVQEPGGSHIFWPPENRRGEQGGELDVDNREGPGPENVYWVQGQGPYGTYKWYVEYYGPAPLERYAGPLRWRVRIKHKGKLQEFRGVLNSIGDRSRTYTLVVGEKD
jgi:hypothetical protein